MIYGLGGLVSRILAVLLLPLYTRYLSPSDYGKGRTLIALTNVIGIVLRLGICALFRFYFDLDGTSGRRGSGSCARRSGSRWGWLRWGPYRRLALAESV